MINLPKILPRIFFHGGDPLQVIFFITARCNLRCSHCFYLDNLNKPANELSLEEIEKLSKGMGYMLWLSLTGGEPFMRKDVAEIAEIFYRNNRYSLLTIVTNGILQDSVLESASRICKECKDSHFILYVSIDGLEETHNRIRGTADGFAKAVDTVRKLESLKKQFKNLNVATITTCTTENQKEMKGLALFLSREVKPDNIAINLVRGKPGTGVLGRVDLKNYFDFIKVQEEGWASGDLQYFKLFGKIFIRKKESLQKKIISEVFTKNKYIIPCLAGKISCVITEGGDIYPCEMIGKKIGNIRDAGYDFRKIWYSAEAEKIRRFIGDTKCHCTYECAITTNILFNAGQLARMCCAPCRKA